jgi:hypothetical protein
MRGSAECALAVVPATTCATVIARNSASTAPMRHEEQSGLLHEQVRATTGHAKPRHH